MDIQIQTMLVRLNLSEQTAQYLVNTEGINTPKLVSQLDFKMIEQLGKNCRKLTPNGGQRGLRINIGQDLQLGIFQVKALTLVSFFINYKFMTSRAIDIDSITEQTLDEIDGFKQTITTMENPPHEAIPRLTKSRKFEFFDEFTEFLNDNLGSVSKRPLGYVVRKDDNVAPSDTQAPFGHVDSPFGSHFKEIEARAPIIRLDQAGEVVGIDKYFSGDNIAVWKLLYATVRDTEFLTHIKKFQKKQDGRKAFKALHTSLLGKQAIDNQIGIAESRLQTLQWDGKARKNWSFNKYVLAHKEQHITLDKLKDLGPYPGIDEGAKRRYFIQGINDPTLESVVAAISGDSEQKTFDAIVEHFNNFIQQKKLYTKAAARTVNVSEISKSGNRSYDKTKKKNISDDGFDKEKDYSKYKMPIRFYTAPEWNKLSAGQRNFMRQSRHQKKEKEGSLAREIKAMKVTIAELTATDKSKRKRVSDSDSESVDSAKPGKKTRVKTTKRG